MNPHTLRKKRGRFGAVTVKSRFKSRYQIRLASRAMLLSVSYVALGMLAGAQKIQAQSAPAAQQTSEAPAPSLPPVTITAPEEKRRVNTASTPTRANNGAARRQSQ